MTFTLIQVLGFTAVHILISAVILYRFHTYRIDKEIQIDCHIAQLIDLQDRMRLQVVKSKDYLRMDERHKGENKALRDRMAKASAEKIDSATIICLRRILGNDRLAMNDKKVHTVVAMKGVLSEVEALDLVVERYATGFSTIEVLTYKSTYVRTVDPRQDERVIEHMADCYEPPKLK
jgi:hypothetical protein